MFGYESFGSHLKKSELSITVVDLSLEDQPLIYVNEAFCKLTDYSSKEVLGRNCRFLQGEGTCKESVKAIAQSIAKKEAVFCDLLNYTKFGEEFYNRLILLPIQLTEKPCYIGLQTSSNELKKSFTESLVQKKGSVEIKDIVNNSLMKLYTFSSPKYLLPEEEKSKVIAKELVNIKAVVHGL